MKGTRLGWPPSFPLHDGLRLLAACWCEDWRSPVRCRIMVAAVFLLVALAVWGQSTGVPAAQPIFAIDARGHAGNAYCLAATPDERYLVSAGLDKTVRIWDVASGEQVRRLVLPVSGPRDGEIHALALSPDGTQAAVGGNIHSLGKGRSVAIVSLRDGTISRVFPGFESPITALAWSRDGRLLAIGFTYDGGSGDAGVRVVDFASGSVVHEDRWLEGRVSVLAFRADHTLFATAHNFPQASRVALYKPSGAGYARVAERMLDQRGAFRAYWTADEKAFIVWGHTLYDGDSLAELPYRLHRGALPAGNRSLLVRESPDSRHLFAALHARDRESGLIRRWSGSGYQRRTFEDLAIPDARVADLVPLRSGVLGYISEDGAVAAVGPDLQLLWRQARSVAEFAGRPEALEVSSDGRRVALPATRGAPSRRLSFVLDDPAFVSAESREEQWRPPLDSRPGLSVSSWRGTHSGTVNGKPLPRVNARERSLAVAVHSSEDALVYGSSHRVLHKVSGDGSEIWRRYLQAEVVAVNLLEGRELVVAATIDGFLHVLRWRDGMVLMRYYLQPGDRKWLAVANAGFYEASIGAEELAGWIVGRDTSRTADFFPLSRFRAAYLLPGMVGHVYAAGDQRRGVAAARKERDGRRAAALPAMRAPFAAAQGEPAAPAGEAVGTRASASGEQPSTPSAEGDAAISSTELARLPPVIDVVQPGYDASVRQTQLRALLRVRSPAGLPVSALRVRVNGQQVAAETAGQRALREEMQEVTVPLPAEDCDVQFVAENAAGASVPASVRVRYLGERKAAAPGDLYVLAIGVSQYDKPEYRLAFAAKDASDFGNLMRRQQGTLYRKVSVRALVDGDASRRSVEEALAWLKQVVGARDTAMVFLAGHGINDQSLGYLYLPRDADVTRLADTGVDFALMRSILASLPGRTLMFVDTCHAGNVIGDARQRLDNTTAINELASSENNIVVFASSTGAQESIEDPAWGNGAFTKALLEGLRGAADVKQRGRVTYKQLDAYVADRVDELTEGQQTPVTPVLQGVPDFIIALVGGLRQPAKP